MFDDEMLTIEDVANYLKLKPQTIYKWAQTGKIPGAKFGKEWRFKRSSIERWIDDNFPREVGADGSERPASPEPPDGDGKVAAAGSHAPSLQLESRHAGSEPQALSLGGETKGPLAEEKRARAKKAQKKKASGPGRN